MAGNTDLAEGWLKLLPCVGSGSNKFHLILAHTHTRVLAQSQTSTLNTSDEMRFVCAQSFSRVWLLTTLWTVAHQAPLAMGFSRQEHWSGLPFPPPGDLPDSGIKPASPASSALAGGFFTTEPPGKPRKMSQRAWSLPYLSSVFFSPPPGFSSVP